MLLKSLLRSLNVLNLLLAITALLAYQMLSPMFNAKIRVTTVPQKASVTEKNEAAAEKPREIPPLMGYTIIAEQNLFHPDRRIPPLKQPEQVLPRPDFVLYGILTSNTVSLAYMEDKKAVHTTPGRGKRQTALKIGDAMSGYVLKEIGDEKVIMVHGEDRMEVYVTPPHGQKERSTVSTASSQPAAYQQINPEQQPQAQQQNPPPIRVLRNRSSTGLPR